MSNKKTGWDIFDSFQPNIEEYTEINRIMDNGETERPYMRERNLLPLETMASLLY